MDQTTRFIETPVDRTPYGSCFLVASLALGLYLLGAWALWDLGSYVKQHHLLSLGRFGSSVQPTASGLVQQVQQAAEQKGQQAENQATQAIKAEADRQLQAQQEAARQQASQAVGQALQQVTSPRPPTK